MSTNQDIAKLDDLIVTTIDSARGYANSAESAKDTRYADFFNQMAEEREGVVARLQARSRELGGTPNEFGSVAAGVHRRWEDLRTALGGGDEAILAEVERGEDYLEQEWERALDDDGVSAETKALLRECFTSVSAGHDRARVLRDALQATD